MENEDKDRWGTSLAHFSSVTMPYKALMLEGMVNDWCPYLATMLRRMGQQSDLSEQDRCFTDVCGCGWLSCLHMTRV